MVGISAVEKCGVLGLFKSKSDLYRFTLGEFGGNWVKENRLEGGY